MKNFIVIIMCLILLTACNSEETTETQTNSPTETTTERSTRTANSIVGTWYELRNDDRLNVWSFKENGCYKYIEESREDNMYDHSGSYTVENNVVTMTDSDGVVKGKYRIKYTDYGVKFMYADRAGSPLELYESRQQALETNPDYHNTLTYYKTIADENGYVIEDGVLIIYVGDAEEITIPSNVKKLDTSCIWGENLKKVTIPGTVKTIERGAFHDELELEYIYIEEGVEEIASRAFSDSAKEFHFPKSVTKMGEDVISGYEGVVGEHIKIYVKKDSYAHKYFIEHGATDNLIVEE
ncbi:MAG: leucine-rich repeat domain-containing protein [Lachnospiraceae bacterium]|nr:leucine-rich repeat domain-containing protein [Lachnospiraceae bacterium]